MIKKLLMLSIASFLYASSEVNVYSHRHYEADKQLFQEFEQQTGIKVNVVNAKANELIKRLEKEGNKSPADLLITSDVGRLYLAKEKGLLKKVESKFLAEVIPAHLKDSEDYWFGLTKRARVIVYNKETVKPEELSTYEALGEKKWEKRVLIRQSSNIYNQSLLASFIAQFGENAAQDWATSIVANMARVPAGSDRDQMKAIVAGVGDVAIVNTYYVGMLLNSQKQNEVQVGQKIGVFFPNQEDRGTHINISGIALTKSSKNEANAIKLIEFLADIKAQKIFAEANYEYPVNKNVKPSKLLQSWGDFKEDKLPLSKLGQYNKEAVMIFNKVGWK